MIVQEKEAGNLKQGSMSGKGISMLFDLLVPMLGAQSAE